MDEAASSTIQPIINSGGDISPQKSPRDPLNPPPIIRQPSIRLQPIIKENGRAEPVRNTQPRTVLFVEPPKSRQDVFTHKEDLQPRPDYSNSLYPGRGTSCNVPNRNVDSRGTYYSTSRSAPPEPLSPSPYPERDSKHHRDELLEPDVYDTQFSSESSNTLSRESGYCSPRHPLTGSYRGTISGISASHDSHVSPGTAPLPKRDFRDSRDQPPSHVFTFPSHGGRDPVYDIPTHSHPPPLVRSSSSPPPPRPSIMKKSPSVGGSIYTRRRDYHDHPHPFPSRHEGPTYRSLPRPNKTRQSSNDSELVRYRSLDRRFDIPFTGSLPRPQTRRSSRSDRRMLERSDSRFDFRSCETSRSSDTRLDKSDVRIDSRPDVRYDSRSSVRSLRESSLSSRRPSTGSRLRFSNEKYFHVYPDKEKRQTRDDDADENFV